MSEIKQGSRVRLRAVRPLVEPWPAGCVLPAHLPYPDSVAAIAHLLAVAVPTIATGGEVYAVASEVARG